MLKSLLLFAVAVALVSALWPWLTRLRLGRFGLGRLPGDLSFARGGRRYHLPIATSLLLSLVLTLLLRLLR